MYGFNNTLLHHQGPLLDLGLEVMLDGEPVSVDTGWTQPIKTSWVPRAPFSWAHHLQKGP